MGIFSDVFEGGSAKKAAENNRLNLANFEKHAYGTIDAGTKNAIGALDSAIGYYAPVRDLGAKYNAAGDMALNALGINGAGGNAAATSAFQAGPGYDFKVNSALDALDRRAASRGMLASGNTTNDTLATVTGLADQAWNDWQNRLYQYAGLGANATNAGAQGSATASAAKAPIYTNDAASKVSVSGDVVRGINDQTTQAANASMAGAGNALNFGINLAKLGIGAMGGGFGGGFGGGGGMPLNLASISAGSPGGTGGGLGGLF